MLSQFYGYHPATAATANYWAFFKYESIHFLPFLKDFKASIGEKMGLRAAEQAAEVWKYLGWTNTQHSFGLFMNFVENYKKNTELSTLIPITYAICQGPVGIKLQTSSMFVPALHRIRQM